LIEEGFSLINISGYIDPSSISAIMVGLIGVIVGAGMTMKFYWFKIKEKFSRN